MNASAFPAGTPLTPTLQSRSHSLPLVKGTRGKDEQGARGGWSDVVAQPAWQFPLAAKPTSPVSVSDYPFPGRVTSFSDKPGHFFFDLGKNIQGGVQLTITLPAYVANQPEAGRRVSVRVAEELATNRTDAIYWPPRTGMNPTNTWTLAATTAPQTLQHHEYFEWRYGELTFGKVPTASECVSHAPEDTTAVLTCPPTETISAIPFVAFGTSSGTCSNPPTFSHNSTCDAHDVAKIVGALCLGKSNCSVPVDTRLLSPAGDPCQKTHKWLSVNITCTANAPVPGPPPRPPPPAILASDFTVSAWVVKAPYDRTKAAVLSSSDATLNDVWELCRCTVFDCLRGVWRCLTMRRCICNCR